MKKHRGVKDRLEAGELVAPDWPLTKKLRKRCYLRPRRWREEDCPVCVAYRGTRCVREGERSEYGHYGMALAARQPKAARPKRSADDDWDAMLAACSRPRHTRRKG